MLVASGRQPWTALIVFLTSAILTATIANAESDERHRGTRIESSSQRSGGHRAVAVTMLAVGGLSIAGGLVALGLDQDEHAAPRGQVQEQYYWDTTPAGITAVAAGGVAACVGVYLLFRGRSVATTPQISRVDDGAIVGIVRSF